MRVVKSGCHGSVTDDQQDVDSLWSTSLHVDISCQFTSNASHGLT